MMMIVNTNYPNYPMNKEIIGDDYPTYEDSVNMTLREKGHYVCNIPATDFTDDEEKMADFNKLTKQEFLDSYSYLTEQEYELTMNQVKLLQEERDVSKNNMERLMQENFELRHRLACIADDIELIDRHIKNNCNKKFKNQVLMPMVLFMQTKHGIMFLT